jgi:transposase
MIICQDPSLSPDALELRSERLGPLPLINRFLDRLGLEAMLEQFVPTNDRRVRLPYAKALGLLLRSILVEREPFYRQHETVSTFASEAFGLTDELAQHAGDDAIGRALERLYDADRAVLVTEIVLAVQREFALSMDELHNDSTTVSFCGQYHGAQGRNVRGKRSPMITFGHSKAHRPDLKQLLFILTTSRDGGVPVQFRCADGNTGDPVTHQETWDALRRVAGRTDFLYVADSKLCAHDPMTYIHEHKGRFVCVMPRNRLEDAEFRKWIQTHEPEWTLVWDREHPRREDGPRDRWWVFRPSLPSKEGWPVVWVYSSLMRLRQEHIRRENLAKAEEILEALNASLSGPRPRHRTKKDLEEHVAEILAQRKVVRYLKVEVFAAESHTFKQARRGRPGPDTTYVRKTHRTWRLRWELDQVAVDYDNKSDGMYPLLTNDRALTDAQALEAHKGQPSIEKRFEQTKSVMEIAPVLLKNVDRIEAFFLVYFLALLVQSLIERELRLAMKREGIEHLPLYPEERETARPTTEQVLRLFSLIQRNVLTCKGVPIKTFYAELTELQEQVLSLLGVPLGAYVPAHAAGGAARN